MRNISPILLLGLASFGIVSGNAGQAASPQTPNPAADRKPVVIELFTSEGCSSCPPADALLKALEVRQPIAGAEIIALEEHVDYWNQDGWEDPFSSAEWTVRQQEYVSKFKGKGPYTPQMIVDGEKEFVGNSAREVQETIRAALQQQMASVSITVEPAAKSDEQRFQVRVGDMPGSGDAKADVWLAVTEDGLQANVDAGENKGRTLQHAAVVRSLQKIGSAGSKSSQFSAEPQVRFKSNWKKENLHVVVFVQDKKSWRILGAASTKVAS